MTWLFLVLLRQSSSDPSGGGGIGDLIPSQWPLAVPAGLVVWWFIKMLVYLNKTVLNWNSARIIESADERRALLKETNDLRHENDDCHRTIRRRERRINDLERALLRCGQELPPERENGV